MAKFDWILALLYAPGKKGFCEEIYSKIKLVKEMFILKSKIEEPTIYNFFPHKQGPFSRLMSNDLDKLIEEKLVIRKDRGVFSLSKKGKARAEGFYNKLNTKEQEVLIEIKKKFNLMKGGDLIDYVYEIYPEYAIKSELIDHPRVEKKPIVISLGYEGKDLDKFLNILLQNRIDIVIDVRNNAFSFKYGFSKSQLSNQLGLVGIKYMNFTDLGTPKELRDFLKATGNYKEFFRRYLKYLKLQNSELNELKKEISGKRACIICMEQDFKKCHRKVVCKELENSGMEVEHLN